jgi:hypothetical protein
MDLKVIEWNKQLEEYLKSLGEFSQIYSINNYINL